MDDSKHIVTVPRVSAEGVVERLVELTKRGVKGLKENLHNSISRIGQWWNDTADTIRQVSNAFAIAGELVGNMIGQKIREVGIASINGLKQIGSDLQQAANSVISAIDKVPTGNVPNNLGLMCQLPPSSPSATPMPTAYNVDALQREFRNSPEYQGLRDGILERLENDKEHMARLKETAQSNTGTLSINANASNTVAVASVSSSLGITFDAQGNIALQTTASTGTGYGASTNATVSVMRTNAPSYRYLEDMSYSAGFSIGAKYAIGYDYVLMEDPRDPWGYYYGSQVSMGLGAGADVHWQVGYTQTVFHFNIYDLGVGINEFFTRLQVA